MPKEKAVLKVFKKWNVRQVAGELQKEKVKSMVDKACGGDTDPTSRIRQYQTQLTRLVDRLDENTVAEYEILAAQWTKDGPPLEVQRK